VLSNTQGVVGTKLIDKLCSGKKISKEDIEEVYHGKIQASKEEIYEACEGMVTEHHIFMLQTIKRDIAYCEELISEVTTRIKTMLSPYENVLELLREIPGLSTKSVEDLVAEIGLDMSVFPNEKHLASWSGLSPGNNESAGKKKTAEQTPATNK
jgi:transposase